MRTRTLAIGLIVIVVGIALIGGGALVLRRATTTVTTFTQPVAGEYVSTELVLNNSIVVVNSPPTAGGMIPTQDVAVVNSTNIGSYAVASNSTAASSETYIGLRGDFNYVVFSSTPPTAKIVLTGSLARTVRSGLLVLGGIVCSIAGIIVAIIGVVRGRKSSGPGTKAATKTTTDDEYYAKRESGPPPP